MDMTEGTERLETLKKVLKRIKEELDQITGGLNGFIEEPEKIKSQIERWEIRTSRRIEESFGHHEAKRFEKMREEINDFSGAVRFNESANTVYQNYLESLLDDIEKDPEFYVASGTTGQKRVHGNEENASNRKDVFIIHGHDEANKYALARYIEKNIGLEARILDEAPGQGRTLIEKFEEEADKCGFAFAVMTPDDIVDSPAQYYAQARPNVAFELGWFFAKLGRRNVCIILKEGTKLHSDLDGISQLRFDNSIKTVFDKVREELTSAGLV
jgi:predicted nucleotide-binding protein